MKPTRVLSGPVSVLLCAAMIVILSATGASTALALDSTTTGNAPLWFQFNVGSVANEETSHVSVTLHQQAACAGGFQIFASGSWGYWDTPTEEDWIGSATDIGYDSYMWAGELVPGAYYARLGYGAKPGCVLGVSGQAVDYLGLVDLGWHLAEAEEPVANPEYVVTAPAIAGADFKLVSAEPAAPQAAPATPALAAASPAPAKADFVQVEKVAAAPAMHDMHDMHDMEMVPNMWMPVTNNDPMMFAFEVGRVPEEQNSHVSVTLYGAPFHTGSFQIFNADGVPFDLPEQDDWMGYAIVEDGENSSWTGDLVPGAYYVLVYPEGMKDCLLAVSGAAITY